MASRLAAHSGLGRPSLKYFIQSGLFSPRTSSAAILTGALYFSVSSPNGQRTAVEGCQVVFFTQGDHGGVVVQNVELQLDRATPGSLGKDLRALREVRAPTVGADLAGL